MFLVDERFLYDIFHPSYPTCTGESVLDVFSRDLALVVKSLREGCPLPPGWVAYEHAAGITAHYEADPRQNPDRYIVPVIGRDNQGQITLSAFTRYAPWECIWCGHDRRWDDSQECPVCGGC